VEGSRTSGVQISWLHEAFGHCPADVDLDTVGYYCKAWILYLFGCILFLDAMGGAASWMYIHCLTDWDQAGQYSWGFAVLSFLYLQLCEACRRTSTTCHSMVAHTYCSSGCGLVYQLVVHRFPSSPLVPWCRPSTSAHSCLLLGPVQHTSRKKASSVH
jgi:hypothetical protein